MCTYEEAPQPVLLKGANGKNKGVLNQSQASLMLLPHGGGRQCEVNCGMKEIGTVTFQHFIIALNASATTNCQTGHYFKLVISRDRRLDGQAARRTRDVYRHRITPRVQRGPVGRQDEREVTQVQYHAYFNHRQDDMKPFFFYEKPPLV